MADVKWIKIVTDIFDDEKILLIENLPDGDRLLIIWFKLLILAGKQNNSGVFVFANSMPYTEEMFSTIFRRPVATVRLALETFKQFGMVEMINNAIMIPNWSKHQTLDQIESRNEYMREYMSKYRNKQKQIASGSVNVNSKLNSKLNVNSLEEELDKELELEKKKSNKTTSLSVETDLSPILTYWNEHSFLADITAITEKRSKMLKARIKEHSMDAIYKAIDNVGKSSFLRGQNDKGWMASFDWVFLPNNFIKVLEGNCNEVKKSNDKTTEERAEKAMAELQNMSIFKSDKVVF